MQEVKVGDKIRIIKMDDCGYDKSAREYAGREGVVEYIDGMGQLHLGQWSDGKSGSLAVIPGVDEFEIIG